MLENLVIIPYRNREPHLKKFIDEVLPLFREELSEFKVVIVEQEDGKLFNRGYVINIGYNEYKNLTKYIITHDVDIYPNKKCIGELYNKTPNTDIMGIYTSHCNTLGGIVKINKETYADMNGFPNNYWGWGAEDKALQNRAETYNKTISKNMLNNDPNRFSLFEIKNDINDRVNDTNFGDRVRFEFDNFKLMSRANKTNHIQQSGLNSMEYRIIDRRKISDDVDWIKVSF
jgi:hypothetical protein